MRAVLVLLVIAIGAAFAADEPGKKVKLPSGKNDLAAGARLFENHCALCHGNDGSGGRGPVLTQPRLKRAPDDAALLKVIEEGIPGTEMQGAWQMDQRELREVAAHVRSLGRVSARAVPGNPAKGEQVYLGKGGCANCHTIRREGRPMGPDLTSIGLRRNAQYLRDSVISPEAAVPDDFLQVRVIPASGPAITGVRLSEDSFTLQLRDDAGRLHSYWKRDLKDIAKERGKSPMPSYQNKLTEEELTDLIAFLVSLREDQ
jgi:putative heme-binding domain-containing protein